MAMCKGRVLDYKALRLMPVMVSAPGKQPVKVLAILDSGCSRTTVDQEFARKLGLPVTTGKEYVLTIRGPEKTDVAYVDFLIQSVKGGKLYPVEGAMTYPHVRFKSKEVPAGKWKEENEYLQDLPLEDMNFQDVKILLGGIRKTCSFLSHIPEGMGRLINTPWCINASWDGLSLAGLGSGRKT